MFLLSNIAYQFFFSPQSHDPEKGLDVEEDIAHDTFTPHKPHTVLHTNRDLESGVQNDDDEDDNEIIHDLDAEEFPDPRPRRRLSQFPTWSSFSSRTSSGVGELWSKVKGKLDPRQSQANLESFSPHYRYLPIISGVIIPLAILLEIPGLTGDWYVVTEENRTIESKRNTPLLNTGLAFSMAFAVFANICLICRFMEKNVQYMTVLCVTFLTIHGMFSCRPFCKYLLAFYQMLLISLR